MLNGIVALHGTGVPPVTNSYESIATVTVGSGGQSTVSFTSIPSTYKHLQIRMYSVANESGLIAFNSDTTNANYREHYLSGNGSTAYAGTYGNSRYTPVIGQGAAIIDILDYTNTNKNKTVRTLEGYDANGSGQVTLESLLWMNTSAITRIDMTVATGLNWLQYTSIALYGIKG